LSIQDYTDSSTLALPRPVPLELNSELDSVRAASTETTRRILVCLLLLAILMLWAWLWPQTGDGDAIMHYLNAHDGLWQPGKLMGSWARVGAKLPLLIPAQFGLLAARWMSAVVSVVCAWQTMRLADDLKIPNAILAAPLLLLQPLVFTLAGDTMTELPLALGLVIAIRLWWARRTLLSCLVIGYLPLVRPEGFFLGILWGMMLLFTPRVGNLHRRMGLAATLAWGTAAWLLGCWIISHDATYFFRNGWAWPADSMPIYGRGSFFDYINRFPLYTGPVLLPFFLLGLHPLLRHKLVIACAVVLLILEWTLPWWQEQYVLPWFGLALVVALGWARRREKIAIAWWAFLLVFALHSVLWWRGWFASCGLLRILACAAPIIAVICLQGFNRAMAFLRRRHLKLFPPPLVIRGRAGVGAERFDDPSGPNDPAPSAKNPHLDPPPEYMGRRKDKWRRKGGSPEGLGRFLAAGMLAMMALWTVLLYVGDRYHYRVFPMQKVCDFVAERHLLADAPVIIFGDPTAQAYLRLPPNPTNLLRHYSERDRECASLLSAPIGSIGMWDNQHAMEWFNVRIQDLPTLGYSVLYDVRQNPPALARLFTPPWAESEMHYVVIRKVQPGRLPAYLGPIR
jgi:hypothetical protein